MILRLILIFLLFSTNVLAQKKDYYFNQAKQQIEESAYYEDVLEGVLRFKIELDSAYVNLIEYREVFGKLSNSALTDLERHLKEISRSHEPLKKIIVINYYHGPDPCNTSGTQTKQGFRQWYKNYLNNLKRKKNISQYFVYLDPEGVEKRSSDIAQWFEDSEGKIAKTFFPFNYPCGSFVVINSKGEYIVYKGEYSKEQVYQVIRKLKFN